MGRLRANPLQIITKEQILSGNFKIPGETALAIGKFDGIHVGHQALIERILEAAKPNDERPEGLIPSIFTFDPSPASFFAGRNIPELSSKEEKYREFEAMGIRLIIEYPMTRESASVSPEDFLRKILCDELKVRFVASGSDLSYGDKGAGDFDLMLRMAEQLGYTCEMVEKIYLDGREISSTWVRELVSEGRMEKAAELIGHPYRISGTVVHGRHLGTSLGFPTINLVPASEKILPPNGVYTSIVRMGCCLYEGITNIGTRPTVTDDPQRVAETYLYGVDKDLYDLDAELSLLSFRRPEQRFPGIDALKAQLERDIQDGKAYFDAQDRQAELC